SALPTRFSTTWRTRAGSRRAGAPPGWGENVSRMFRLPASGWRNATASLAASFKSAGTGLSGDGRAYERKSVRRRARRLVSKRAAGARSAAEAAAGPAPAAGPPCNSRSSRSSRLRPMAFNGFRISCARPAATSPSSARRSASRRAASPRLVPPQLLDALDQNAPRDAETQHGEVADGHLHVVRISLGRLQGVAARGGPRLVRFHVEDLRPFGARLRLAIGHRERAAIRVEDLFLRTVEDLDLREDLAFRKPRRDEPVDLRLLELQDERVPRRALGDAACEPLGV